MLQRSIPSTGESLPLVGLGTWRTFDVGSAQSARAPLLDVLGRLIDAGGSVIDSSPMYGRAESTVGDLLVTLGERGRTFIATKVWTEGRDAGVAQLTRSMQLLKVQQLDLVQIHNLVDWKVQLGTLREWKAAGKLRYLGITHYHRDAHAELAAIMRSEALDFVQFNYALDDRAAEQLLLPLAAERGIAVLINRPFGEGATLRRLARTPLPAFAAELGCANWSGLALKYVLAHEAVTCAIPATAKPDHMDGNMRAGSGALPDATLCRRILAAAGP